MDYLERIRAVALLSREHESSSKTPAIAFAKAFSEFNANPKNVDIAFKYEEYFTVRAGVRRMLKQMDKEKALYLAGAQEAFEQANESVCPV